MPTIKVDLEAMLHEIQRGRSAIEFDKKTHASNLEHRHAMDNNMIIMSSEVEKLHTEPAIAEKRARVAMAADAKPIPRYLPDKHDNREMGYGYVRYRHSSYSMYHMQVGVDSHSQDTIGAPFHHSYDHQRTQVPR